MDAIRVSHFRGMVDIECGDDLSFGSIANMYKGGRSGSGLQLSAELEPIRNQINDACEDVAEALCRLHLVMIDATPTPED